jgi:hypothetical protein
MNDAPRRTLQALQGESPWVKDAPRGVYVHRDSGEERAAVTSVVKCLDQGPGLRWAVELERERFRGHIEKSHEAAAQLSQAGVATESVLVNLVLRLKNAARYEPLACDEVRNAAASAGQRLHRLIAWGLDGKQGPQPSYDVDLRHAATEFGKWLRNVRPVTLATELTVAGEAGYAGTLDAYLEIEGLGRTVVDFKSGRRLYSTAMVQAAAYATALREGGDPVDALMVVHLPVAPDVATLGPLSLKGTEAIEELYRDAFLPALAVWRWRQGARQ